MSITIKCDEIENITQGYFKEPLLRVTVDDMDVEYLMTQLDEDSVLDCIDDDKIAAYLQNRGWSTIEE